MLLSVFLMKYRKLILLLSKPSSKTMAIKEDARLPKAI